MSQCHQEANTRMMLHLCHAAKQGRTKAYLRTVNCDVVVLAINLFGNMGLGELWIGFGVGKTYKDIPIHYIKLILRSHRCDNILFTHAHNVILYLPCLELERRSHGMHVTLGSARQNLP